MTRTKRRTSGPRRSRSTFEQILLGMLLAGLLVVAFLIYSVLRVTGRDSRPVADEAPIAVSRSLVGHWVADDWAGGSDPWVDRISGYEATPPSGTNGAAKLAGAIAGTSGDSGVGFDGVDDYFSVRSAENPIGGSRAVTVAVFFRAAPNLETSATPAASPSPGSLVGALAGSSIPWSLTHNTSGVAQGSFGTQVVPSQSVDLLDGEPHTMMLTWQSAARRGDGVARLYVDGFLVGSTESAISLARIGDAGGFVVGAAAGSTIECCEGGTGERYFDGVIGELRLYDDVQDPATIHAEILGGSAVTDQATSVASGTATLTGYGYPNRTASEAYFRYGTDPTLNDGITTRSQPSGGGFVPVRVTETLVGLDDDKRFYYRLEVQNSNGTFVGRTQSFFLGPRITVEHPPGQPLRDGVATVDFISAIGRPTDPKTVTVTNTSQFEVTRLSVSVDGPNSSEFEVGALDATALAPGAQTSFTVEFTPSSDETASATMHLASNLTGDENPFDVALAGTVATIWTGPSITFTNPCGDCATDMLTPNVWLTRSNTGGLFNKTAESKASGKESLSPLDTEWAYGTTANLSDLQFQPWFQWLGLKSPSRALDRDAVLHLISDDIYLDVTLTTWQDGGGGGFAYTRATPGPEDGGS